VGGDEVHIISLVPHSLADIRGDVTNIAAALGVPERGRRVAAQMEATIQVWTSRDCSIGIMYGWNYMGLVATQPPLHSADVDHY